MLEASSNMLKRPDRSTAYVTSGNITPDAAKCDHAAGLLIAHTGALWEVPLEERYDLGFREGSKTAGGTSRNVERLGGLCDSDHQNQ